MNETINIQDNKDFQEMQQLTEYLKQFRQLSIVEQKGEIIKNAKLLAGLTCEMANSVGINDKELYISDVLDETNKSSGYLEMLLVLLSSTQKSLSKFNDGITELLEIKLR